MPRALDALPEPSRRGEAAETIALRSVLADIIVEHSPLTVRALYYRASAIGAVPKTEAGYDKVQALSVTMRWDRSISFGSIIDEGRTLRDVATDTSPGSAISLAALTYRRSLQEHSDVYTEVWCEKDTLLSIILEPANTLTVPVLSLRGYNSLTNGYESTQRILQRERNSDKHTVILYLGDHDPHGVELQEAFISTLNKMGAYPTVYDIAVDAKQIAELDLETRPTKTKDKHGKPLRMPKCWLTGGWDVSRSCDVDAIAPNTLREIVKTKIIEIIGEENIATAQKQEEEEREVLQAFADKWEEE